MLKGGGPPSDQRDDGGGRIPTGAQSLHPHIPIGRSSSVCAETLVRHRNYPTRRGGSFFLYEKSVLRESDHPHGRKPEVCTDSTTPFSALKKALKKLRVPRGFNPLGRAARQRLAALPRRSVCIKFRSPALKRGRDSSIIYPEIFDARKRSLGQKAGSWRRPALR